MQLLRPFEPHNEKIILTGDTQLQSHYLAFNFYIDAPDGLIDFNGLTEKSTSQRAHELWKHTCFEAFWSTCQNQFYWEFNVSPNGLWNLYYFNNYRVPSPPQENFDFNLYDFQFTPKKITAILASSIPLTKLEISLTTILKTTNNQTLHFAIQHCGKKPDFHLRESFQLKRSVLI